jgi:hypothetical protein
MKLDIWIASHINCENRLIVLKHCIESIFNQTIKPRQLIISISSSIGIEKIKDVLSQFKSVLKNGEILMHYKYYISESRLLQMQHIQKLINKYCIHNPPETLNIMFCDDDDLNDLKRVENYLKYATSQEQVYCSKIIEFIDTDKIIDSPIQFPTDTLFYNNTIDFAGLIVPFWKVKQFFDYNQLTLSGKDDKIFLQSLGNIIVIPESVYYVRKQSLNPQISVARNYAS